MIRRDFSLPEEDDFNGLKEIFLQENEVPVPVYETFEWVEFRNGKPENHSFTRVIGWKGKSNDTL